MIFVTVGTQWPFDRLVRAMDDWAADHPDRDVIAQIFNRSYCPRHMRWVEDLSPAHFRRHCEQAELIVAHAGIGTILQALECGRPIVVMPRRLALREHLNDHQMETVRALQGKAGISVAWSAADIDRAIDDAESGLVTPPIKPRASPELIATVRDFIAGL